MGGRHEARTWALQFLFQRDFNKGDMVEDLVVFWNKKKAGTKLKKFTEEIIRGVETNLSDLDARLEGYAENWNVKRMGAVDRNVMRVALFEMFYRQDIPPIVSINEAVDLAKQFSGDESGKFVNGILDRARRDLDRSNRTVEKNKT